MWTSQFSTLPKKCNNLLRSHGPLHAKPEEGFPAPLLDLWLPSVFGPRRAFLIPAEHVRRRFYRHLLDRRAYVVMERASGSNHSHANDDVPALFGVTSTGRTPCRCLPDPE